MVGDSDKVDKAYEEHLGCPLVLKSVNQDMLMPSAHSITSQYSSSCVLKVDHSRGHRCRFRHQQSVFASLSLPTLIPIKIQLLALCMIWQGGLRRKSSCGCRCTIFWF